MNELENIIKNDDADIDEQNFQYVKVNTYNDLKDKLIDEYNNLGYDLDSIIAIDEYGSTFIFKRNKNMPRFSKINGLTNTYFNIKKDKKRYLESASLMWSKIKWFMTFAFAFGLLSIGLLPLSIIYFNQIELFILNIVMFIVFLINTYIFFYKYVKYGLSKKKKISKIKKYDEDLDNIMLEIKQLIYR